jgi:phospholipid/cholesterol/gamma-HCH transport system substrate-binding protein
VNVGTVNGLHLRPDNLVKVDFSIPKDIKLTQGTAVRIRYANLTGDRYVDLEPGDKSRGGSLAPGSTIPAVQTKPALNLDDLANGFQPLLRALSPNDVNQLASSIIEIAQGQGGAVQGLLTHVAAVTSTLADRDQLIGSVVDNLNTVLRTVTDRSGGLDRLISGLSRLTTGLAEQRDSIGRSITKVSTLATDTSNLLASLRPGLKGTITQTRRLASSLDASSDVLNQVLTDYPQALVTLGQNGHYGSFFNFYICELRFRFSDEGSAVPIITPYVRSNEPRCLV